MIRLELATWTVGDSFRFFLSSWNQVRKAVNRLARCRGLVLDEKRGRDERVSSGDSSGVSVRSTDFIAAPPPVTTHGEAGMTEVGVVELRSEDTSGVAGCNLVNRAAAWVSLAAVESSASDRSRGFSSDFFLTSMLAVSAVDARCRMLTEPERALPLSDRIRLV